MAIVSASKASKLVGKSVPTITRAIKSGKLSAKPRDGGGWEIDTSALFSVYDAVKPESDVTHEKLGNETPNETSVLQAKLEVMEQRFEDAQGTIEDLRTRLTKSDEERTRLTLMLTGPEKATEIAKQEEAPRPTEKRLTFLERLTGRAKG